MREGLLWNNYSHNSPSRICFYDMLLKRKIVFASTL